MSHTTSSIRPSATRWSLPRRSLVALACALALPFGLPGAHAAVAAAPAGAQASALAPGFISFTAGVTPFIGKITYAPQSAKAVDHVDVTIAPRAGATAKPVHLRFSLAAIQARGGVGGGGELTVPVYGLYAGLLNHVTLTTTFADATSEALPVDVTTTAYTDPNKIYDRPNKMTPRNPALTLGYDYFYVKSGLGAPLVIDVDGDIRWAAKGISSAFSSNFLPDNRFLIAAQHAKQVQTQDLDGTVVTSTVQSDTIFEFSHNIDFGREAYIATPDTKVAGQKNMESTLVELTPEGVVLRTWDFAQIFTDWLNAHGENPAGLVQPGQNWMHINSSFYNPADNSLTVSSREQFVINIDYDTADIHWILGDPTKQWHTFPSLAAKGITLAPNDLYPIGQHSINMTQDGMLLLFNNGTPSDVVVKGAPKGQSRKFSAVSMYSLDPAHFRGSEVWHFEHQRNLKSKYCGSARDGGGGTKLIDYAEVGTQGNHMRIVGLDASSQTVFEYDYSNPSTFTCGTGWHARPFPFDNLVFN